MSKYTTQIISTVKDLGIEIKSIMPRTSQEDGVIELGGKYDSLHIQLGTNYYVVGRETAEGEFIFKDGQGNLELELNEVLAA